MPRRYPGERLPADKWQVEFHSPHIGCTYRVFGRSIPEARRSLQGMIWGWFSLPAGFGSTFASVDHLSAAVATAVDQTALLIRGKPNCPRASVTPSHRQFSVTITRLTKE